MYIGIFIIRTSARKRHLFVDNMASLLIEFIQITLMAFRVKVLKKRKVYQNYVNDHSCLSHGRKIIYYFETIPIESIIGFFV